MTTAPAPTARPTLTVEIWSDLICPWCWIGKRRFDEALATFAHTCAIRVVTFTRPLATRVRHARVAALALATFVSAASLSRSPRTR